MNKRKPKRSAEDITDAKRKKPKLKEAEEEREGSSSSDEAEYERVPRPSTWESKSDKKRVHYLLPLKATHGKLILQEPTQLQRKGQSNVCGVLVLASTPAL